MYKQWANVVPAVFKDVTQGEVVNTFKVMVENIFNGVATAKVALEKWKQ